MIVGIGTDLVAVSRITQSMKKFEHRFVEKILSSAERTPFKQAANPAQFLASRFAAKEAFVKALGTGMRAGLWFTQITVSTDPLGKPSICCDGQAAQIVKSKSITDIHLSISHDKEYAIAFVVACS